jgi:hypothetical protein
VGALRLHECLVLSEAQERGKAGFGLYMSMYNDDILAMPRRINAGVEERESQKNTLPSLS